MTRSGSCACGALRVTCAGEPKTVSLCHCPACQKRTGSAYGVAAFYDRGDVRVEGAARRYTRPSDSGHPVTFHFCPVCGSTVFWEPQRLPALVAVGVGAFADPGFPAPTQAVNERYRHPWVNGIG